METTLHWSHHLLLPCAPDSAARARFFIRGELVEHDLTHLSDDVELVVGELASNAIVHARTPFSVSLAANTVFVLVRVRDQAPASTLRPPRADFLTATDPARIGGRGLLLVEVFSSSWGVEPERDGGKTVWATFSIDQA
ncbi:ATP-binding protein [Nocardioides sp. BP30]|uniref:ATP-binding protein n=1 Tax=Nocardioides sp. BP30 TaxID=3036374 RepID=UPI002468CCC7|nr:ATP-binding protein [Nocardioides sp. BP30]WGL50807.1 ATP-binding protein [Nocardioides sp. BP30]